MTVAVSADTQAYMLAKGYDSRKVSTIHNGFDIREADAVQCQRGSIRAGLAISPDQPVIGMVAYMYPHVKGHETFLRAAKLVHQENPYVRFAILGGPLYNVDQWYEKSLHDLSENLGLKDSVMFIGNQPSALPFMDAMDIIVLPSNVREGFGMVLVEAMSRRKPVIGSRIGGIPEVVDDGVTGVLVPPGQERDLASAMLGLIGNPQLMTAMGVQGRLRAETHFSLDRMVDRYEEQYMAVVSGEEVVC
jgi:glycosyltransferase involved in cell wall biosynthesis